MKIAIFTDVYGPGNGGIASSIASQKNTLEELGHKVTVFYPSLKKSHNATEIVVPTCQHLHPDGIAIARRPRLIEKWVLNHFPDFKEFDIVHVHYEAGASIAGMHLARQFKIPLIQTMHGREDSAVMANILSPFKTLGGFLLNWFHSWYLPHPVKVKKDDYLATTKARASIWTLMVNHANYVDLVLAPSRHFKNKLQHYGVTKPIKILTNTIDDNLIPAKLAVRTLKSGEPLHMIWNSRLSHEKRFREFAQALQKTNFPYKMDVYGDGNELQQAKKWCTRRQLPITFHGSKPRPQILRQMAKCHLGISASYNFDTQGMNLLEGLATGLPMFFCDPDMKEVMPKDSFVCATKPDIETMATTLNQLYNHPEQIAKMSKTAMEHRKDVLRSTHKRDLEQIYQKMV